MKGNAAVAAASRADRLDRAGLRRACRLLAARDHGLARAIARYGYPPLWARRPGFATLIRMILEQQVSLDSARAMYIRLQLATGGVTAESVGRLGEHGLRRLGVTRQKARYAADLGAAVEAGAIKLSDFAQPGDSGRAALLAIRGIGPWTADVYRLFALRLPDVWPVGDVALADAVHQIKGLRARPSQDSLTRIAVEWAPWRSAAARILWHWYLSSRGRR